MEGVDFTEYAGAPWVYGVDPRLDLKFTEANEPESLSGTADEVMAIA